MVLNNSVAFLGYDRVDLILKRIMAEAAEKAE